MQPQKCNNQMDKEPIGIQFAHGGWFTFGREGTN